MWFDVKAALANLDPAPSDTGHVAEVADVARPSAMELFPANVAKVAEVATPSGRETHGGKQTALPSTPDVCAVCGIADWTVSLTEPDGRKLHVKCWKAEPQKER